MRSRTSNVAALCEHCGHPRHRHEYVNETYPAMCVHADPVSVDHEGDPYDGICWCLDFERENLSSSLDKGPESV